MSRVYRESSHSPAYKKERISSGYEIVDSIELEKRFPTLRNVLIVNFRFSPRRLSKTIKNSMFYVLSESLPFVFEVSSETLNEHLDEDIIADTIAYLSQLRRIRIIQSLKNKDLIFSSLINKKGEFSEKGQLEIIFIHPLLNYRLTNLSFPANFKKSREEELHSLIQLEYEESMEYTEIEFPENCCIVSLRLTRKGMPRSFTCLIWFMEKRSASCCRM